MPQLKTEARSGHRKTPNLNVGFVSLGCAKNLVDTQIMAGALVTQGMHLAPAPERADVILVNTCAFIASAREESAEAIHWACAHKNAGGCRAVIVAGCMPQRYQAKMGKAFPDVDAFIGLDQLETIPAIARRVCRGEPARIRVSPHARKLYNPPAPALVFSGGPHAYLKVAEGCNHRCAFCAIPSIRGRFRSRSQADLLAEARALLKAGYREIDLVAQDVIRYGADRTDDADLPGLLRALDALEGDFWLRLLYGYPARIDDALLDAIDASRHVCRYLDLPIQHSHPDMLRAMNRADTLDDVPGLTHRLRRSLPGVTLRTTCLVGFPGETESHFEHLLATVKEARFDHLGAFVFSPETGTPAWSMAGRPPVEVAEARRETLLRAQRRVSREQLRARIGGQYAALLEAPLRQTRRWRARIETQAPEIDGITRVANAPQRAGAGDFLPVRITGVYGYDLQAVFAGSL